jgi:hypothetical protein
MNTEPEKPKVIDLGWSNGWQARPEIVKSCELAGHKLQSTNLDPTHHGLDTMVRCDICGYVYHYDSSD